CDLVAHTKELVSKAKQIWFRVYLFTIVSEISIMYLHVFIITFAAWISFSFAEPVESNHGLGPCNEENYGRRELIKGSDGKETVLICFKEGGFYSWKKGATETELDETGGVMEDVMLKREAATEFFQRDRRDLNHECYSECCNWEEVREHYEHDIPAA
ncbi:Hypothetical predicted protein, partial [Paramuricea clavata]